MTDMGKDIAKATAKQVQDFHKRSDVDSGPSALHHTLGLDSNQAAPGDKVRELERRLEEIEKQLDIVSGRPSTLGNVRRLNTEMNNTMSSVNYLWSQMQLLQTQLIDATDTLNEALLDIFSLNSSINAMFPVGSFMFFNTYAPLNDQWIICDGRTFNSSTYPSLYSMLGTNTTPDLRSKFIKGASMMYYGGDSGIIGGASTLTLLPSNLPKHTHPATATVSTNGNHSHGLSFSTDPGGSSQNVPLGQAAVDRSNSAPVNSNGAHTHTVEVTVGENTNSPYPLTIDPAHYKMIIAIRGRSTL